MLSKNKVIQPLWIVFKIPYTNEEPVIELEEEIEKLRSTVKFFQEMYLLDD